MRLSKWQLILAGIPVFICLTLLGRYAVDARTTGTNPIGASADVFCVGPTSSEVCADSAGGLIPTTNQTQNMGTAAMQWLNVRASSATFAGTVVHTGNIDITAGSISLQMLTTTQLITAVPVSSGAIVYNSTRGALCISTGTGAGAFIYLSTGGVGGANWTRCYP